MLQAARRYGYLATVFGLALLLALPQDVLAQQHAVSSADLQKDLVAASSARQNNLAQLDRFFSSPQARQALKSVHIKDQQVRDAVRVLDDAELARLAAQSQKIQNDFAAGSLTNQQITYIIIALATAVLILIIVEAR